MESVSPKISQHPTSYAPMEDRETATTATHGSTLPRNHLTTGRWDTSLFSCGNDIVPNCLMSFFCPWVSFAQILARVGVAQYFPTVLVLAMCYFTWVGAILAFIFMFYFRYKLRRQLNINGAIYQDCLISFFCCCCSLAQMASHTHSYSKGVCSFEPRETIPVSC
ncbi:hypothetical protein THRCLA_20053 [Thraustotheca clavata]|uniref:PLAC8 family protein n=1 Tax=Thraustotheca clavata TaxID=74557 RepID=A0A1W0ABW7_9STRA|nr:hypothetical protein THRCLA_20053 [Thraustotheca clavata]